MTCFVINLNGSFQSDYANSPWKIVALLDLCQRVAGRIRNQDPARVRRGPRGGSWWRTKATPAENTNESLSKAYQDLMNRMKVERAEADGADKEVRRFRGERAQMVSNIAAIRNELDGALILNERDRGLNVEVVGLREERDHLRDLLDESQRENLSLLLEIRSQRRRRSPFYSRIPYPKRRRRSEGVRHSGLGC